MVPVELFGSTELPADRRAAVLPDPRPALLLLVHACSRARRRSSAVDGQPARRRRRARDQGHRRTGTRCSRARRRERLEDVLLGYITQRRWFAGKARRAQVRRRSTDVDRLSARVDGTAYLVHRRRSPTRRAIPTRTCCRWRTPAPPRRAQILERWPHAGDRLAARPRAPTQRGRVLCTTRSARQASPTRCSRRSPGAAASTGPNGHAGRLDDQGVRAPARPRDHQAGGRPVGGRAEQQLGGLRRAADPQDLPPPRGGHEPRARGRPLPHRAAPTSRRSPRSPAAWSTAASGRAGDARDPPGLRAQPGRRLAVHADDARRTSSAAPRLRADGDPLHRRPPQPRAGERRTSCRRWRRGPSARTSSRPGCSASAPPSCTRRSRSDPRRPGLRAGARSRSRTSARSISRSTRCRAAVDGAAAQPAQAPAGGRARRGAPGARAGAADHVTRSARSWAGG